MECAEQCVSAAEAGGEKIHRPATANTKRIILNDSQDLESKEIFTRLQSVDSLLGATGRAVVSASVLFLTLASTARSQIGCFCVSYCCFFFFSKPQSKQICTQSADTQSLCSGRSLPSLRRADLIKVRRSSQKGVKYECVGSFAADAGEISIQFTLLWINAAPPSPSTAPPLNKCHTSDPRRLISPWLQL